jgi:hypothetical protein
MCHIYQAKKDTACLPMTSMAFYGGCDIRESVGVKNNGVVRILQYTTYK